MVNNRKGVALLYVLIALVFVGAVGLLVLNMANKEKTDSGLRASSEAARSMATAGLTYATNYFSDPATDKSELIGLLNDWFKNKSDKKKWLAGGENSFSSQTENDGIRFRVEIVNMDFSRFNEIGNPIDVMFRSEAIDKSGSRSENSGFYTITGFEPSEIIIKTPEINALDMRGGLNEINTKLIVNGDTYFEDASSAWGGALNFSGHEFNGQFRRMARANNAEFRLRDATFRGPAYFGSLPGIAPPSLNFGGGGIATRFQGGLGSETAMVVATTGMIIERGNVYFNNNVSGDGSINTWRFNDAGSILQGRKGRSYGSCALTPTTRCLISPSSPQTPVTPNLEDEMNIPALLNLKPTPPPLSLNWSALPPAFQLNQSNVTGTTLNDIYNSHKTGTKHMLNGWVVAEMTGPESPISTTPGTFDGKMILILNRPTSGSFGFSFQSRFPEVSENGRIVIIVKNGTSVSRIGNSGTIRGIVINEGNGELLLGAPTTGTNRAMTIDGAVHSMGPGALRLEGGDGGTVTINFDNRPTLVSNILNELKDFIVASESSGGAGGDMEVSVKRKAGVPVSTTMRGRAY